MIKKNRLGVSVIKISLLEKGYFGRIIRIK